MLKTRLARLECEADRRREKDCVQLSLVVFDTVEITLAHEAKARRLGLPVLIMDV